MYVYVCIYIDIYVYDSRALRVVWGGLGRV